ncbi:tetratricopeptide repeat protein [Anabaena azotica]|uniref:tetratricopeptide repeat protein n=1 Tax=Anabaena azotica TaxID=197653 RepID=UPI0039A481F8
MTNQQPDNLDFNLGVINQSSLRKVIRTITLSQGAFSLILLRCNYTFFQQQIFNKLQEIETVKIKRIYFPPNVTTLYANIATQLGDEWKNEKAAALMVFGLESVQNIDKVLTSANQAREELRNNFNFPIFFWVNDPILRKIIRLAPDFKNWATTIEFKPPSSQLLDFIQQETDKIFAGDITNILFAYLCQELAIAKQDLQQRGEVLNPSINASLEYVFGYRDYLDDNLDSALEHYQQSLKFWQESNNLDRQGTLLVNLGLIYYRKASINQVDNKNLWEQARNYFQQSLEIFKQIQRTDLLSRSLTLLCQVYLKLQTWDELEQLVDQSLKIHQQNNNYQLFWAKDYGFLAELALYKANLIEAKNQAETALEILENIKQSNTVDIFTNEQVYYQFLLGKS